jgi:hypothetical protein
VSVTGFVSVRVSSRRRIVESIAGRGEGPVLGHEAKIALSASRKAIATIQRVAGRPAQGFVGILMPPQSFATIREIAR